MTETKRQKVSVSGQHTRPVSSRRVFGTCLSSAILVLLGILLYLWPHMRLVELGYEHRELRTQREHLLQQQKEYEVEIASLHRLGRIEKMAEQMGLRAPRVAQVIYLRETAESDAQGAER